MLFIRHSIGPPTGKVLRTSNFVAIQAITYHIIYSMCSVFISNRFKPVHAACILADTSSALVRFGSVQFGMVGCGSLILQNISSATSKKERSPEMAGIQQHQ